MKKILLYVSNGVGLGHLRRISLITNFLSIRKIEKILISSALYPQIFGKFYHHFVRIIPQTDELTKDPLATYKARLANAQKCLMVVRKHNPDLVIADFNLNSPFVFYPIKYILQNTKNKCIYIWRLGDKASVLDILENKYSELGLFTKILIPHSDEEIIELMSPRFLNLINSDPRFKLCGPITKEISKNNIQKFRKKYKINNQDQCVLVILGGGGKFLSGRCTSAVRIIKYLDSIAHKLKDIVPQVRIILSIGPLFKDKSRIKNIKNSFGDRINIIDFEEGIVELMHSADLIIASAGYNTCYEIIRSKTPAILVPLSRGGKEQQERAAYLEKKGVCRIYNGGGSKELLNLVQVCIIMSAKMRASFKGFSNLSYGNREAAKEILKILNSS